MNTKAFRSDKLNKVVAWFRAGYATDAPQFGHTAIVALCPAGVTYLAR
jgi:hypothetical protein